MKFLRSLGTFALIGVAATITHVIAGVVYHRYFGLSPLPANLLAYATGAVVTICGNAAFTFRTSVDLGVVLRGAATLTATLALQQFLVWLITGPLALPYEAALAVLVTAVPLLTYFALKGFVFRLPTGRAD